MVCDQDPELRFRRKNLRDDDSRLFEIKKWKSAIELSKRGGYRTVEVGVGIIRVEESRLQRIVGWND